MEKITKEEFIKRLTDDEFSSEPDTLIEYRLPVVQYFINNVLKAPIEIVRKEDDYTLINYAFAAIKKNEKLWKKI